MEVDRAGPRRLLVLIDGLPPESATWRTDRLPPTEDLLAALLERTDTWSRAQIEFAAGKRVRVPGPIQIERPGQPQAVPERAERPKIETDPRTVAAWFKQHVGG